MRYILLSIIAISIVLTPAFADEANILFGREDITESMLLSVLKAAQVQDEIQDLDRGLDTLLGRSENTIVLF